MGLFDNKTFATAGEDYDMYFKLKDKGKIAAINIVVKHLEGAHRASLKKQLLKQYQYGEAHGVLMRLYGLRMDGKRYIAVKSLLVFSLLVPVINIVALLLLFIRGTIPLFWLCNKVNDKRLIFLPFVNVARYCIYTIAFWKGFLTKKQEFRY